MIGSPVNTSEASSFVPNLFSLAGSALETSLSALALDNVRVSSGTDDWTMVVVPGMSINAATSGSFSGSGTGLDKA
jgi:hypothetical protein